MDLTPWQRRGPYVVEDLLSRNLCDDLLRHFDASVQRPRSYQGLVDPSQRQCQYVEVPPPVAVSIDRIVTAHVTEFFGAQSVPMASQAQLIYRYGAGVGFVTHHDEVTDVELARSRSNQQPVVAGDITVVVFLNEPDEYDGGALYFEEPDVELRPRRGTMVTFPATRQFMHGVRPVKQGERYTLLARRAVVGSALAGQGQSPRDGYACPSLPSATSAAR
jgi:PKHD-type hydroxylase